MNVYEAIETVYVAAVQLKYAKKEHADALAAVRELLAAYDALAPEAKAWSVYPTAQYYVIDPNGESIWFDDEPEPNEWRWTNADWFDGVGYKMGRNIKLPIGIDWRLCKWQRPEVK